MRNGVPHLVQYQGSKRLLAAQILQYMPHIFGRLVEPFAGTAAITLAVAHGRRAAHYHLNDVNAPLMRLLCAVVQQPEQTIAAYTRLWQAQFTHKDHVAHFYEVRDAFNAGNDTQAGLLYLLARCVKGAVRYSKNGDFNQSPDKRRHGVRPHVIAHSIRNIAYLLQGRTTFSALDYREVLSNVRHGDIVYMDPPYQGVSHTRDHRYIIGVSYTEFVAAVECLSEHGVEYIISYDGACGERVYGCDLPSTLGCKKILLSAGVSTQATLLGKRQLTYEALYISNGLWDRASRAIKQLSFIGYAV